MKAFLMFSDRDFDIEQKMPSNAPTITQDLELNTLLEAMASDDTFLCEVAKRALFNSLRDRSTILYRQSILQDCLKNAAIVRDIYSVATQALEGERKIFWGFGSKSPTSILRRSIAVMQVFVESLKRLRKLADRHGDRFESRGFTTLFSMLKRELSDEYLERVEVHLRQLECVGGVLVSASLGDGNKGDNYVLRVPHELKQTWWERLFAPKPPGYSFDLHPRDESGARALSELRDRGINRVAAALAQSSDHVLSFFALLRTEAAFYVACLNVHARLSKKGEPVCFPVPAECSERRFLVHGLYDVCLALNVERRIVGNDVDADGKSLVMITGANQGGKSTFLRSVGVSQLMMQCGMFVAAESYCANLCYGLFTHYKREEDASMESGKLDEELGRMSDIVDDITPDSMLLLNESFAATNEREGSEIARQIVVALLEKRVKVLFVTHLYDLARKIYDARMENAMFLRAERRTDRERTFKMLEGEPLQTSYGCDLYNRIFGPDAPDMEHSAAQP